MVDWKSPQVIAANEVSYLKLHHVIFGVYLWEWFITLDFEWQYISGKKQFRWPLIFYFLNRYCLFFSLLGITIGLNVRSEINCQALYLFNQVMGLMTIGFVSINLAIRTMAVWGQRWFIVCPLILLILGHWSILMHGVILRASWDPAGACVVVAADSKILTVAYVYTMCFDFIVLCLMAYRLHTWAAGSSRIAKMIFTDGLVYFILALLANVAAVTFVLLALNPIMAIIAAAPASTMSTIVACRAVRRLANFMTKGAEVYQAVSKMSFTPASGVRQATYPTVLSGTERGVHIHMETIEQRETLDGKADATQPDFKSHLVL